MNHRTSIDDDYELTTAINDLSDRIEDYVICVEDGDANMEDELAQIVRYAIYARGIIRELQRTLENSRAVEISVSQGNDPYRVHLDTKRHQHRFLNVDEFVDWARQRGYWKAKVEYENKSYLFYPNTPLRISHDM